MTTFYTNAPNSVFFNRCVHPAFREAPVMSRFRTPSDGSVTSTCHTMLEEAISVWRRRAVAQVPYGSAHESIGCITAALELRKDSLELLLLRAALHIAWGDLAAAEVDASTCAALYQGRPDVYYVRGWARAGLNNVSGAEADLRTCILMLHPSDPNRHNQEQELWALLQWAPQVPEQQRAAAIQASAARLAQADQLAWEALAHGNQVFSEWYLAAAAQQVVSGPQRPPGLPRCPRPASRPAPERSLQLCSAAASKEGSPTSEAGTTPAAAHKEAHSKTLSPVKTATADELCTAAPDGAKAAPTTDPISPNTVLPGPLRKPTTRPASSRADTADDVSASLAASSAPTGAGRRTTSAADLAADVDSLISTCNYLSHEKQPLSSAELSRPAPLEICPGLRKLGSSDGSAESSPALSAGGCAGDDGLDVSGAEDDVSDRVVMKSSLRASAPAFMPAAGFSPLEPDTAAAVDGSRADGAVAGYGASAEPAKEQLLEQQPLSESSGPDLALAVALADMDSESPALDLALAAASSGASAEPAKKQRSKSKTNNAQKKRKGRKGRT
ncbi:hypothetical protein COCSUDRAFT_43835 [Coccomyxa subellipsoidea C-169]|uniref:Uncharacterized protein n=1 Tax=Coccomyxa subellipsoidea (strain C-169) TaxID=574566 RepID=I0YPQ5_COCSC|nr:hypothetical protein COCSUDRAFT_43835 [Coccomyxa subellipsoidea C-169]EIE20374.1 hypothetical protein COCSUDRAFT_43835 [Coccomyxa subellipsoidea C-169]|eukprot:XP_005644918.1 hypothetical protein COCSUDRAFT_43835 [Coccomyxa subellipsoidea C-169]